MCLMRPDRPSTLPDLLVLCDAEGPCANAVKDAQRTKTHDGTSQTLSILWGCKVNVSRQAARSITI